MERGQTTLDFAVGVSIFIFAIVFVFTFVPGTLQPFTANAQDETAGTDRVADLVVQDLVAEPGKPYVLDGHCTAALMDDSAAPECDFDGSDLASRLDLPPRQSINVTIRGNLTDGLERLCWDDANDEIVDTGVSGCVAYATGDDPPQNTDSVVTARRIVSIEGTTGVVEVRLW